ncbi:hypothetical protein [Burkholderia phage vB_BglM_WTB]
MAAPITPSVNGLRQHRQKLANALDFAIKQHQLFNTNQMLPAQVVSYDRANNVATVQPLISHTDLSGGARQRFSLVQIPVISIGGGGFHLNFPLAKDDLGWIYAADRDISLFKQSLAMSQAPTNRSHDFADSMFIPDVFRKYTIAGEDAASVVLQSTDGTTKISISEGSILIAAPTKVTIRVPETEITGNLTVDGNVTIQGDTTMQGTSSTQGLTSANGGFTAKEGIACTLPTETTIGGIAVFTHVHTNGNQGQDTGPFNSSN